MGGFEVQTFVALLRLEWRAAGRSFVVVEMGAANDLLHSSSFGAGVGARVLSQSTRLAVVREVSRATVRGDGDAKR